MSSLKLLSAQFLNTQVVFGNHLLLPILHAVLCTEFNHFLLWFLSSSPFQACALPAAPFPSSINLMLFLSIGKNTLYSKTAIPSYRVCFSNNYFIKTFFSCFYWVTKNTHQRNRKKKKPTLALLIKRGLKETLQNSNNIFMYRIKSLLIFHVG